MGANQGRAKGNKQKAEYRNREGMHERSGRIERGKRKKRERKTSTEVATVRRNGKRRETKKQRLSSEALQQKWTKESGSQASTPEEKSKRGSPVERLRERSREGRKETNRKPSTKTRKECMRNQAGKNGENVRSESGRRAPNKPL